MHVTIECITSQTGQNAYAWNQLVEDAVKIAGGFIAGYFAHKLALSRDRKSRRIAAIDEFRAVLDGQLAKLDLIESADGESAFFRASLSVIGEAVYKLRSYVSESQWAPIGTLWDQYREERYDQTEQEQLHSALNGRPAQRERLRMDLNKIRRAAG